MFCDLHTHSDFSDGSLSPTELVLAAKEKELIVALCDHDKTSGLPEFMNAARKHGVTAVPGVEFSCDYGMHEIHIVGLFVREEYYGAVNELCGKVYLGKEKSNRNLIDKLNEAGYKIDYEQLKNSVPDGRFNRANVAIELKKMGVVQSVKEAMQGILSQKQGYYVPAKRLDAFEGIEFLRSIGAVPVLAHPMISLSVEVLEQFLPSAKEHGLVAMETMYSTYDAISQMQARRLAVKYGLLESGGSDFHGENKPDIELGVPRVEERIYNMLALEAKT